MPFTWFWMAAWSACRLEGWLISLMLLGPSAALGAAVARVSYGIFYMAGNTINSGSDFDYMMGATPGYTGLEYSNADAG